MVCGTKQVYLYTLLPELAISQPEDFKQYLRMSEECFEDILRQVFEHIENKYSYLRPSYSVEIHLIPLFGF